MLTMSLAVNMALDRGGGFNNRNGEVDDWDVSTSARHEILFIGGQVLSCLGRFTLFPDHHQTT